MALLPSSGEQIQMEKGSGTFEYRQKTDRNLLYSESWIKEILPRGLVNY